MDLLGKGFKQDGVYLIDPDNQGPFQVYCDQKTNGGGWVVFQKRIDGSEDFYRNWSDYKNGFGNLEREFWLGNDKIHRLTNRHQELLVELEDFNNLTAHAQYSYFSIDSEENGYELHLGSYSGSAGDSLTYHQNMKFSTKDVYNDKSNVSCSLIFSGGWWYKNCQAVYLNGLYKLRFNVNWYRFRGFDALKAASMKIRGVTGTMYTVRDE